MPFYNDSMPPRYALVALDRPEGHQEAAYPGFYATNRLRSLLSKEMIFRDLGRSFYLWDAHLQIRLDDNTRSYPGWESQRIY